ncbi:MAG: Fe-S oxidoreductase, partial [Bacteroidota bacterium]|nr:Fe-S oxidoreductase [Bacteroidota bacterium]
MKILSIIVFALILVAAVGLFARNIKRMIRNIKLGREVDRSDNKKERMAQMLRIAFGQSKMVRRPVSGFLHVVVYIGFVIINIEVLEIIVDGLTGSHRIFAPSLGGFYDFLIFTFEILAFLVLVSVVIFWLRRNVMNIKRFMMGELKGWPKNDANYILYFEVVLMSLFLTMNATDFILQTRGVEGYAHAGEIYGSFPISGFIVPLFEGMADSTLIIVERAAWWLHIVGILIFLNYLYWSKHLHILLAFPNVYLAKLTPQGKFTNMDAVTKEVKL